MFEKPKSIQQFIEYKHSIEKERPILTVEPRLITIDGVDGSGKSTIARKVFERLEEKFGKGKVVLVDITNLRGSPKQERLRKIAEVESMAGDRLDKIYAAGVNRAYEEIIIPSLKEGKIVVVDRSKIDLLRYALEKEDQEAIERRGKYLKEGTPTHRFWAGNRIFIEAESDDILQNLSERKNLSKYDPKNIEGIEKRIFAQQEAESRIMNMQHESGDIKVVTKRNERIDDPKMKESYLDKLADEIVNDLEIPKEKGAET